MLSSTNTNQAKDPSISLNDREIRISKISINLGFFIGCVNVLIWFIIPPLGYSMIRREFSMWYLLVFVCSVFFALTLFFLSFGIFIFTNFKYKSQRISIENTFISTLISFYYYITSLVIGWNGWIMSINTLNFILLTLTLFSPVIIIRLIYHSKKFQKAVLKYLKHEEKVQLAKEDILKVLNSKSSRLFEGDTDKERLNLRVKLIANIEYRWLKKILTDKNYNEKIRFQIARLVYPDDTEEVLKLLDISID